MFRLDRLAYGHAGDAQPVGDGISELRIHYAPGYRMYFKQQGNAVITLLCGGDKSTKRSTSKPRNGCWTTGVDNMAGKLTTYDPAEDLTSNIAVAVFLAEAFETEDVGYAAIRP